MLFLIGNLFSTLHAHSHHLHTSLRAPYVSTNPKTSAQTIAERSMRMKIFGSEQVDTDFRDAYVGRISEWHETMNGE